MNIEDWSFRTKNSLPSRNVTLLLVLMFHVPEISAHESDKFFVGDIDFLLWRYLFMEVANSRFAMTNDTRSRVTELGNTN